jgi:hypothetical protein
MIMPGVFEFGTKRWTEVDLELLEIGTLWDL